MAGATSPQRFLRFQNRVPSRSFSGFSIRREVTNFFSSAGLAVSTAEMSGLALKRLRGRAMRAFKRPRSMFGSTHAPMRQIAAYAMRAVNRAK